MTGQKSNAELLVQEQIDAYNRQDMEGFLKSYADSVKVYMYPAIFQYQGKEAMRKEYIDMFTNLKTLHCTVEKRIIVGNKVIDEELVVYDKNKPAIHAVAIYTIAGDKITEVCFMGE